MEQPVGRGGSMMGFCGCVWWLVIGTEVWNEVLIGGLGMGSSSEIGQAVLGYTSGLSFFFLQGYYGYFLSGAHSSSTGLVAFFFNSSGLWE